MSSCLVFAVGYFPMHDLTEWLWYTSPVSWNGKFQLYMQFSKVREMYLLMKLCFTQNSLATRDFSGDPGTEGLKNVTKAFQFQVTSLTEQGPDFRQYVKSLHEYLLTSAVTVVCQWWLTMESNLTKITEDQVFSSGFLCNSKKKKKVWQISFCIPLSKMRMWEHKDATLLLNFSYHAGKQHSKQMYQCPSQADQARFILHGGVRMRVGVCKLSQSLGNISSWKLLSL